MEPAHSVATDVLVTATDRCAMSCEVDSGETRFYFENADSRLQLDFDWPGFARFMRVAATIIERLRAIPNGAPIEFEVTANDDRDADIITALRMATDKDNKWSLAACPSLPENPTRGPQDEEDEQHAPASLTTHAGVTVNGNGALKCEVLPDQIELRFGDNNSGLQLFLNYQGFTKFMTVATTVVKQLQALPDDTYINFKVWDNDDKGPDALTSATRQSPEDG
jgi:hypothetical protein